MKRRNFIKVGALFVPTLLLPRKTSAIIPLPIVSSKKTNSGGACNTESFVQGTVFDETQNFTFYTYLATSFVTGGSGFTVCKIQAELISLGTVAAGTITGKLYTNSAGSPGTLVGSGSVAVDRTTVTGQAFYSFSSVNSTLNSSTTYWIVLQASSVDTDGSNAVFWFKDLTGEAGNCKGSTDGSSWDSFGGNMSFNFKLFSS